MDLTFVQSILIYSMVLERTSYFQPLQSEFFFVMTFALCSFAENLIKVTALDFKHWVVVVILAFMVIPTDLIRKIIEKKRENK